MESALLPIALFAVGLMGFANQRGSVCTVAAIEQIVWRKRFDRLFGLIEASLWVGGGGLVLLKSLGVLPVVPAGYAAGAMAIVGGVLFGIGATVNRACVIGSVARLGSGEWAYLASPPGFYVGALALSRLPGPALLTEEPMALRAPGWLAWLIGALLLSRLLLYARQLRRAGNPAPTRIWSPRAAAIVIGITFVTATEIAGKWTYTDLLSDLARGVTQQTAHHLMFGGALLAGAIAGGWTAKRLEYVRPDLVSVTRTFLGSTIMGAGSALIPGGNDTLILVGIPLLWPYAWLAFASICATIFAGSVMARALKACFRLDRLPRT
jgi:toxin CptA